MKFNIGQKIIACFIAVLIINTLVLTLYTLPKFEKTIYQEKQVNMREKVETVTSMLNYYHGLETEGRLTTEQAQQMAREAIRVMRYDGDNYYWIDTTDVINVLMPSDPETEGKSRMNETDTNGKYMIKEMVAGAIGNPKDGFYYDYWFPKMGEEEPSPKGSYVKLFGPWNWVVGTGIYLDDLETMVAAEKREQLMINGSLMLMTLVLLTLYSNKYIKKPIVTMMAGAKEFATGNFTNNIEVKSQDELGELATALNHMADSLKALIQDISENAHRLAAHSQQLAASSEEVSATTEEVASTTVEVSAMSTQSADNANSAAEESEKVVQIAQAGNQSVTNTINKINQIA
ncbi:methyl-accepting chemotaxis protein, partial [Peptococcaceae bacterium 1198_IL3148]